MRIRLWTGLFGLVAACALGAAAAGAPAAAPKQQTFGSPDEAVKALMAAVKAHDDKSMLAVLGSGARKVIYSGDAVADHAGRERFAAAYDEANKLDMQGDAKAILSVGKDAWPFPIPVVKAGDGWRFDAKQGAEEILNRRIGRNELSTVQALGAYVDAQREYYLPIRRRTSCCSTRRKWSAQGQARRPVLSHARGRAPSPLGQLFASAKAAGTRATRRQAGPVSRLLLPHPQGAGAGCEGRRLRLRGARQDDRRVRDGGLPGDLRQFGHHDLHRQPRWHGVREGPGAQDGRDRRRRSPSSIPTRAGSGTDTELPAGRAIIPTHDRHCSRRQRTRREIRGGSARRPAGSRS